MLISFLAVLAVFVLASTAWILFRSRRQQLAAALVTATTVHQALLIAAPLVFAGLVDLRFERPMSVNVGEAELTMVAFVDLVYVTIFCAALLAVGHVVSRSKVPELKATGTATPVLAVLVVFGLARMIQSITQAVPSFEQVTHHADVVVRFGVLENLLAWADGAFLMAAFAAAGVLVSDSAARRWLRTASVVLLILLVAAGIGEGIRGRVVWAASFLALGAVLNRRLRAIGPAVLLMVLLVPLSSFLAGPLRSLYFNELEGESRLRILLFALKEGYQRDVVPSEDREPFLTNAFRRAQGPRNSAVLLRLHDEGHGAGLAPLWGALVLPVPRAVWPQKPPAGSVDDFNQGLAMYIVRRVGWDAPEYNMGPFLASAHAYWEGGIAGVLLAAIVSAALWAFVVMGGRRTGHTVRTLSALVLLAALPIDGLFTMLVPVWVIVARFWTALLPLWLLAQILRVIRATMITGRRVSLQRRKRENCVQAPV